MIDPYKHWIQDDFEQGIRLRDEEIASLRARLAVVERERDAARRWARAWKRVAYAERSDARAWARTARMAWGVSDDEMRERRNGRKTNV